MAGLNSVQLIGNLGRDPDMRFTQNGTPVASLNIATTRKWKNSQGELQEDTEWHRVSVWGKQAEHCKEYLSKGRQVFVQGRLRTSEYEKDGIKRWSTDVVAERVIFLGGGGGDGRPHPSAQDEPPMQEPDSDDIPF